MNFSLSQTMTGYKKRAFLRRYFRPGPVLSRYLPLYLLLIFALQACSQVKQPYSDIFNTRPAVIKTSAGNVEVWTLAYEAPLKGTATIIPGFPGSVLESVPLGHELARRGYRVHLLNPPGHGQSAPGNPLWDYSFPMYGTALFETIRSLETQQATQGEYLLIAHSAGAEMAFKLIRKQAEQHALPQNGKLVLINPWLPSLSNRPIPWTREDEDLLRYSPWLVKLLGPAAKHEAHQRLFVDPKRPQNRAYLDAHERLTENLGGWWPFDDRFVRLMQRTLHTQKAILEQGSKYEITAHETKQLDQELVQANVQILVIRSAPRLDQIIPDDYQHALQTAMLRKLSQVTSRFSEINNGGHMLQVEQLQAVLNTITATPVSHPEN